MTLGHGEMVCGAVGLTDGIPVVVPPAGPVVDGVRVLVVSEGPEGPVVVGKPGPVVSEGPDGSVVDG